MIKIAPSIVSASLINIESVIQNLETSGADMIHFDIEDGYFVPVMNLGVKIIKELRNLTDLPFDVHLMMVQPEWIIPVMANYGVDRLSVHYEVCPYPRRTLKKITDYGMVAGLAFNPKTPIPDLRFCFPYLSYIVLLTTEPEDWSGDHLPSVLDKMKTNRGKYKGVEWVVDGGVSQENIQHVYSAGANVIISGRAVFQNNTIKKNIQVMKEKCQDDNQECL
jgi:ribulose-phosphate 3-epimerase